MVVQKIDLSRDARVPASGTLKIFFQRFFYTHFSFIKIDDLSAATVNFRKRPRSNFVQRVSVGITLRNHSVGRVAVTYSDPLRYYGVSIVTEPPYMRQIIPMEVNTTEHI